MATKIPDIIKWPDIKDRIRVGITDSDIADTEVLINNNNWAIAEVSL